MTSLCALLPLDLETSKWQTSLFCAIGFKAFYFYNYGQQVLQTKWQIYPSHCLPKQHIWILSGTQDNIICLPKPLHIVGFLLILWNISKSTGQIAIKFSRDIHVPHFVDTMAVSNKHGLCMSCMHVGDWKGMAIYRFHSSTWQHRHRPSVASTSLQFGLIGNFVKVVKTGDRRQIFLSRYSIVLDYHVGQSQCHVQIKVTVKRMNTRFSVRKLL